MKIGGFEPCTVTDFPNRVASIIFTVGCNFRCPFCYNNDLLSEDRFNQSNRREISVEKMKVYLEKYKSMIDGVVLTGGEPLMAVGIINLVKEIKEMGFEVKIDTNGSYPDVLNELISNNYVDYIAMDLKGPLDMYPKLVKYNNPANIQRSIDMLKNSTIPHEFRITLNPVLTKQAIIDTISLVTQEKVFIQQFDPTNAQDPAARTLIPMTKEDIDYIIEQTKDIAIITIR